MQFKFVLKQSTKLHRQQKYIFLRTIDKISKFNKHGITFNLWTRIDKKQSFIAKKAFS